jgi:hypothetical protein
LIPPTGPIRIADIRLPTVTAPLDHEVTLLALEEASTAGYSIRWFDALAPGPTQLYAALAALDLKAGQRVGRVPRRCQPLQGTLRGLSRSQARTAAAPFSRRRPRSRRSARAIGFVSASLAGDAGPDLDRWSIANRPVAESTTLRFLILSPQTAGEALGDEIPPDPFFPNSQDTGGRHAASRSVPWWR